jgi:hypothetical protein
VELGRLRRGARLLGDATAGSMRLLGTWDPRLLGAVAWWLFDAAVLYAMLSAFGGAPLLAVAVLAYFVGQVGNTLPIPGAVSGGIVGVLLAFGVPAEHAVVSVLAYRAVAIWLPGAIGLAALSSLRRTLARWGSEDAAREPAATPAEDVAAEPRLALRRPSAAARHRAAPEHAAA